MSKSSLKEKEKVKLLQDLLIFEQEERRGLAATLHDKKNELMQVSFPLLNLSKAISNTKDVTEIKKIIETFQADCRKISTSIYHSLAHLTGILYGIRTLINEKKSDNEEIEIELNCNVTEFSGLDKIKEYGIYKLFVAILEYLIISEARSILVSVKLEKNDLDIKIEGYYFADQIKNKEDHEKKLKQIQGRLVLQNAQIHSDTNWKNIFRFKAPVK